MKLTTQTLFSLFPFLIQANYHTIKKSGLIMRDYAHGIFDAFMKFSGFADNVEDIVNHGCWCAKLNLYHPHYRFLGGSEPIDDMDKLCKEWFQTRYCNDNLAGGSCSGVEIGLSSRDYLMLGEYAIKISQNLGLTAVEESVCVEAADDCSNDTCLVDLHYIKKIISFYAENRETFNTTEIIEDGICVSTPSTELKQCEGEAPALKIVKVTTTSIEEPTKSTWLSTTSTTTSTTFTSTSTEEPTTSTTFTTTSNL